LSNTIWKVGQNLFQLVCKEITRNYIINNSVADPGCLFWIPDPDFYSFRIPDPKTATKDSGEKKFTFF
jgi:hypothetical protein